MVLEILCVEPICPQYSGVLETCLALRYWFLRCLAVKVLSHLLPTVYETTLFHWTCDPPYRQPLSFDRAITNPIQCNQLLCSKRPVAPLPYSQSLSFVKTVTNHMQCHRRMSRGRTPPPLLNNFCRGTE